MRKRKKKSNLPQNGAREASGFHRHHRGTLGCYRGTIPFFFVPMPFTLFALAHYSKRRQNESLAVAWPMSGREGREGRWNGERKETFRDSACGSSALVHCARMRSSRDRPLAFF